PALHGGGHRLARALAAEDTERAVAMVGEVAVELDPAPVARPEVAGRRAPGIVAPLPVDAEITLGAERGGGRPRVHVDGLLAATPQLPQLGGGEAGGGDGGLRRGGDLEDAGGDRIGALEARAPGD